MVGDDRDGDKDEKDVEPVEEEVLDRRDGRRLAVVALAEEGRGLVG